MENEGESPVRRRGAQINGRTEGPKRADGTDVDRAIRDNKRTDLVDDSANGLDSVQIRGGQDGRNDRAIGSTDMDSKNGVLRRNDRDNSPMEVTEEGAQNAPLSGPKTNTGMADVTTAGPDDYASAPTVGVPNAQQEARKRAESTEANDGESNAAVSQEEMADAVAQTGTSTDYQPAY